MEQLGIEPGLLFAQIVNFTIIVFVLTKLLYKPILEMLSKRREEIARGLELTEKMRLEEGKLVQKKAKILETAKGEAQAILASARQKAKEEADAILAGVQDETKLLVASGKSDLVTERNAMEKEIRTYAIGLAAAMTKKLLPTVLTDKDKEVILAKNINELESVSIN